MVTNVWEGSGSLEAHAPNNPSLKKTHAREAPNAKAQAPPNAKAQGPKPMPVSMRKHTGTHTCDVWSKGTGDGGLEETLANKTIKPPEPALLASQSNNPASQSPSPTPSLATTHTKQNATKQANRWHRG